MKISVCMASYNGSKYIGVQLESILKQLGTDDELVIVDDASIDNTVEIIRNFNDLRIKLYINQFNIGVVPTFNRALLLTTGELIFLSDQDDRWYDNKIHTVHNIFSTQPVDLIVHDAVVTKGGIIIIRSLFAFRNSSPNYAKNIISNTYTGCCMAFKREILNKILPIPTKSGVFHDAWIGILAKYYGYKVLFVNVPLIEYNRHDQNVSTFKRRNVIYILMDRFVFLLAMLKHISHSFLK